jgi:hypothetical protein
MKIYTVLEPPDGKSERVAFVPEGFSWGALVFGLLWALWHRMWVVSLLLFAVSAILSIATNFELLGPGFAALLQFGIGLIFAFEARSLQAKSLERVGFRRATLIQASNGEAAERVYFSGRRPVSRPLQVRATPDDTLGIFGNV